MIKKILLILFSTYWIITLGYNLPNNPIRAEWGKFFYKFGVVYNQKWSFFAPPPRMNNRLYYSFFDEQKKLISSFEILEPLSNSKREKLPFNTQEESLDYIINSSINQLYQIVIRDRDQLEAMEDNQGKSIESLEKLVRDSLTVNLHKVKEFRTLVNFSNYLLNEKITTTSDLAGARFIKISISEIDIPKFQLRNVLGKNKIERIFLESNFVILNDYKENG